MIDVTEINTQLCFATSETALHTSFANIAHRISTETEYDNSGQVPFLPLNRLNSTLERQSCLEKISAVTQSGLFTSGPFVGELEQTLARFYAAEACIATSSGTDALKIALKAAGIGLGDEVIIPLNSFAATENAVMAIGAKPVFANIDASYNIDPAEIDRLKNAQTKAVIPVCLYGSIRNIADIYHQAHRQQLAVIIDAAQCFGIPAVLDYCDALTLSFNPFKNIGSVGKSGAVLTRSSEMAIRAKQYAYHGFFAGKKNIKAQDWGFNSRMDNLQAATLLAKLDYFAGNAYKRSFLAARYRFLLNDLVSDLSCPTEVRENTWHLFPLLLRQKNRDALIAFAKQRGVELAVFYPLLSHQGPHHLAVRYPCPEQFSRSEMIHSALVHLPLHNHMSLAEQNTVSEVLHDFFR